MTKLAVQETFPVVPLVALIGKFTETTCESLIKTRKASPSQVAIR